MRADICRVVNIKNKNKEGYADKALILDEKDFDFFISCNTRRMVSRNLFGFINSQYHTFMYEITRNGIYVKKTYIKMFVISNRHILFDLPTKGCAGNESCILCTEHDMHCITIYVYWYTKKTKIYILIIWTIDQ